MTQQHMTQQQQQQRFQLRTNAEIKQIAHNRPEELINGFVPSGGVMVLAGAPGTGKSFTALSWAAAIAEGSQWFGRATRQAPVVYVLGEGFNSFGDRVEAWESVNGRPMSDNLWYLDGSTSGIDLKDPYLVQQLIEGISHVQPGLIVFDTLSVLARLDSENDNAEVAQVMANVNRIVQATGATAMLIHHTTKTSGSVRGASAFVGNADTVVVAAKEKNIEGGATTSPFLLSTSAQHGGKQRSGEPKIMSGFSIATPGVLAHGSSNSGNGPTARKDPNDINVIMAAARAAHEENKRLEERDD